MSLRSELARLGLRWFIKRRRYATVAAARQSLLAAARWIPRPRAGTEVRRIDAGGVPGEVITTPASRPDRHVLFLHGGGYVTGSPALYRHFTWRIATAARARVLALDYRLAPEHPFPAALDDSVAAYLWLVGGMGDPRRTAVMGDSAGGGLALALLSRLRDDGLDLPAAAIALSPWTDLALAGASLSLNARSDPMLNAADARLFAECYLAGADPRHPYASPLYGNPAGLPPTLIHVGSDEILRDDAVRMAAALREAGCRVEIEVWRRMPHVWHLFAPVLPEAKQAIANIGAFVDQVLPSD
ncbi:MAG TPA: alpha/beta hydrolase [Xanthobacteraceae bacterium]|nr:alpha/beta hydrolase [Xanthobacteraceae bacterium]